MASMIEVLREYKHLAAKRRAEGALAPALQTRFEALEALVKAEASRRKPDRIETPSQNALPAVSLESNGSAPLSPASSSTVSVRPRSASFASRPPPPIQPERDTPISMPAATPTSVPQTTSSTQNLQERERPEPWMWAAVVLLASLGLLSSLSFGLAKDDGIIELLQGVGVVGLGSWAVAYPALMAWRELAARRSSAQVSEPDFRARTPVVEPVVAVLCALAAVIWLLVGGYSDEGLRRLLGYLTGLATWLAALGGVAVLLVRPVAARYARERAFRQYLQGGAHAFEKNNSKRARRLFELALVEADGLDRETHALRRLEEAYAHEADELRARGWSERADELMRTFRQTFGTRRSPPRGASASGSSLQPAPESTSDLPQPRPARVLAVGEVPIEPSNAPTTDPSGARRVAERLSSRGRHREALEHLLDAGLAVPPHMARAAAQDYIQSGLLRSADAIYDALDERQIPEFYKAVAVEWSRQEGAPPQPALRLAKLLEHMGETEVAARISCQGVLSGLGPSTARRNLAELALQLCQQLRHDPPPEVLEALDRLLAAGDAYRRAGDDASARRCYATLADRLLEQPNQRELLIPVLNRLFKLDKFLDDRLMTPLVEDVLENQTSGHQAVRILTRYRARHRDDHRITVRLFELMVQQGQLEDALKLLHEMSLVTGSRPGSVLHHFEMLRRRFPDDGRIDVGHARALIKAGQVQNAAQTLLEMLPRVRDHGLGKEALALVDSVFEWGHPDPELRNAAGQMLSRLGDADGALNAYEAYVSSGGHDPTAISKAAEILGSRLAHDSGAPNYASHLRLARFYLMAGAPQDAIPFLEVARASQEHRVEADLFLARAEVAASNPRRAVQVLRDAIDGRHPRETPELHYELARVYDLLGERKKARQIDHALAEYAPDAVRSYQDNRPMLEKRDTEWMPGLHADALEAPSDTDVGAAMRSASETEATSIDDDDALTLEQALAPRYRLSKRLGAGGMGDVYLARDEVLGRPVAIKVLRRTLATDLFISKFREEARIVAKLSHPGIVSVYDIGQQRDWSYIVMEYVRGPNLSALVNASMPPSRSDLVEYIAAVADAMAYAHGQGVIHRDLKPANILVGHDGKIKVTDFGIAHVLQGDGGEETAFSAAGLQVGTVNYMAPEQLRGRAVDGRTDIYLLGTTLYYTLCRRYPFMGEAVAVRKLREEPVPLTRYLTDLSPELETCVTSCIARDPDDRFQRMEELALVLRMVPEAQSTH